MTEEVKELVTPKFRCSFMYIFEPNKKFKGQLKEEREWRYELTMLIPKSEDISGVKALIKTTIEDKWGSKPPKYLTLPLKDGDNTDLEEQHGHWVLQARTKMPGFPIIDEKREPIIDPRSFVSGDYAKALISAWTYDREKTGVGISLNAIQRVAKGEPFGRGPVDVAEYFEPVESGEDDPNNYDGMDLG
jgi:hypothetical protein